MEMAIRKAASSIILAGWMGVTAASAAQFPMRHEHIRKGCDGVMTVDDSGVRFAGPKGHSWDWKYTDIQQLQLEPGRIRILSYKDDKWRLGADREFEFTGAPPYETLLRVWKDIMDQRFVAVLPPLANVEGVFSIPAKHLKRISGSEGALVFGDDSIAYATSAPGESRTWRYSDIDNISSSGPFQFTITTFERATSHYGDRKGFNFQLKQPITEARYNEIWLQIERKNGRIQ
jgi:hypothetical protein